MIDIWHHITDWLTTFAILQTEKCPLETQIMTGCQILITNNVSCNVHSQLVQKFRFCRHMGWGGGALVNGGFPPYLLNNIVHIINHVRFVVKTTPRTSQTNIVWTWKPVELSQLLMIGIILSIVDYPCISWDPPICAHN